MIYRFLPLLLISQQAFAQLHPALQSHEAFIKEIANKKWECSYTNYPQLRFNENKIEALNPNGSILAELVGLTHIEPGIIRVGPNGYGYTEFFVFSDDLQTLAIARMKDIHEFTVVGSTTAATLPSASEDRPLNVEFKDHPDWKKALIHSDKMEILDGSGSPFATNQAFAFFSNFQGVTPSSNSASTILSRKTPGGWYLSDGNMGTAVRTDKSGYFRPFLATRLPEFIHRMAHFNHPLVLAGYEDLAATQEKYSLQLTINGFGGTSEQVARCYQEMGKLRGYARSYSGSSVLLKNGFDHVQTNFADNRKLLLEFGIDLAEAQCDAGDFAAAKSTLSSVYAHLPPLGGDISTRYFFFRALGAAEFGLRAYPQAAKHFTTNLALATEADLKGNMIESLLDLIPCQLAQNQPALANKSLIQCMAIQDDRAAKNPKSNFDTWKLAFACVAMGSYKEALKYSPPRQMRNSIAYEEYGRLVSLLNDGDRTEAKKLAKNFVGRFSDISEVSVRNDIDPMTVKLTQAIADPSPANISSLEQLWASQVESLRNRPLKNHLFARVMVVTISRLKSGR